MRAIFFFTVSFFTLAFHVQAQSTPDGAFIGTGEDESGVYRATVQLKIGEVTNELLPTYPFTGTMVFERRSTEIPERPLQGRMRGDVLNGSDTGRFRYNVPGTVRTGTYELEYDSTQDRIFLALAASKLGGWTNEREDNRILLERRVSARELTGGWAFSDGNVMTVTKSGSRYAGSYRGTAASGHPDLVGALLGRLRRATWLGTFRVQENDFQANSGFSFRYFNESPPALKGTIGADSYTLLKQEVDLPFP